MADEHGHDATCVPEWVPELRAGVRADVYPVSPPAPAATPAELVLDRDTVTSGYAEHKPPYEFGSLLGSETVSPSALAGVRSALNALRKAPPSVLQRQPLLGPPAAVLTPSSSRKPFPLQKPSAKSSLEDWFNRLASGGAFSTAALSKAVPLGPAIVRAVGKVLEMMAARGVPTQRAVWYIRIAVLNECVKQVRPDRPAPSPRMFWTRQLCGLLKIELEAFRAKRLPSAREYFWHYVLDLARWQADESLLDLAPWLDRIAGGVRMDLAHGGAIAASPGSRIVLRAAETFITEFSASPPANRRLIDALLAAVDSAGGAAAFSSPEALALAAATTSATATASAAAAVTASGSGGGGDGLTTAPAISPSTVTSAKLPPAVRIAALLRTLLLASGVSSSKLPPCDENELVALVSLAEKEKTSTGPVEAVVPLPTLEVSTMSPQAVSRMLERAPCSGDIAGICAPLRSLFDSDDRGGSRAAVSFLCAWAVRGPMRMSPHAVSIVSSLIMELDGSSGCSSEAPAFQAEIWTYVKTLDIVRSAGACTAPSGCQGSQEDIGRKDCYGYFVDPDESAENARMVRLIAQLYHVGQFSLSSYLKEVGRLVAISHPSARRHLLYVSALPEPSDRSTADSRRALLRRGQRVTGKLRGFGGVDDEALTAVLGNDVEAAVLHGIRIQASGCLGTALATAEAVLGPDNDKTDVPERRVLSILAFLSSSGMQLMAVEWLLRILLEGKENKLACDPSSVCAMIYALDNLAPFVSSSGNLRRCLKLICSLSVVYLKSHDGGSVLSALESTAASLSARFAPNSGSGNARWALWVAHLAESSAVSRRIVAALLLGSPDAASDLSDASLAALRRTVEGGPDGEDSPLGSLENCWGLTPDDDLARMASIRGTSSSLQNLAAFVSFRGEADEEAGPPCLGSWVTANAVLGCVVIPEIKRALVACSGIQDDVSHLVHVLHSSLELLREGILGHDLYGARPTLVIELVALLGAAALGSPGEKAKLLLWELLLAPWVRISLLPSAGDGLMKRLRAQLGSFLGDGADLAAVSRMILEVSVVLFAGPLRSDGSNAVDEGVVIRLFAWVEWGVTEFLLAAIANSRSANGQIEEFGRSIGEAAGTIRFCEQAEMLMDIVVRCSPEGKIGNVVEQLTAATVEGLAQGMGALVAHVLVEASLDGQTVPQTEREAWAAFDATRCTMMKTFSPLLEPPLDAVIMAMLEQLASASDKLQSPDAGVLRPDLSSNGMMFSSAVESRFLVLESLLLKCVQQYNKLSVSSDTELTATQEKTMSAAIGIADIMASAAPLLLPSALSAGLKALSVAVSLAERDGPATVSMLAPAAAIVFVDGKETTSKRTGTEVAAEGDQSEVRVSLRSRIGMLLSPIEVWLDASQQASLRTVCSRRQEMMSVAGNRMRICALNVDGSEIDTWNLLEGYGRGAEEEPAIPVQAFDLQSEESKVAGGRSLNGKLAPAQGDGETVLVDNAVVRLKRTYSTYACLTVR